ncbi:isopenicillin N synthase family oxygenase [Kineosporia sp. J2-2]|uniref:Isopenicillin N synthase family oxygenase n=1 Tax=Kineosporia corallincola TaxID=2835133 RepID=A0ABS5T8Y3_9ACTN|nr:2-oxoglutarate and iron-dependent oxygenase domain-containing protein [Kineosporia corallincola]MBT0767523.1 isopenicillin N synthase family oxygenase [Kineosporia corallincola]
MNTAHTRDGQPAIPTIDLSAFREGSPADRARVAADLDRAASTTGFFQVTGHGIPDEVQTGLTAAMDGFFNLPMWQKKALRPASPEFNRGYTPPLAERIGLGADTGSPTELFEAFNVGRSTEDFPGLGLDELQYAPNLWPLRPESFEPGVTAWFEQAARVSREITAVMAVALGLDQQFFAGYQDHSLEVLRLNNYRVPTAEIPPASGPVGAGAHTDRGIVTVLWADPEVRGLQMLHGEGVWEDVIPSPGALLVNLGDLLARWTNDRWISAPHRVLPPTDGEGRLVRRRSAAFFHDGNADAVISVLPGCADAEESVRYESVTVADHLAARPAESRSPVGVNP